MDTEHMIDYLIAGSLIKILDASTASPSIAFVERDDESPSGFRTIYHPLDSEGFVEGRHVTPLGATLEGTILKGKRGLVKDYLMGCFGLSGAQAKRVVNEAHAALQF